MKLDPKTKKFAAAAFLLLLWQAAAMLLNQKLLLASPADVIQRLFSIWREPAFFASVLFSFVRICAGFLLGFTVGVILAVISGKYSAVKILLQPVMATIKSVPVASFIILALIWLNSSQLSVFISFLMVLPVIYNNVLSGIQSIDPKMLQMADVFRIPWGKRFLFIWLPTIKPQLTAACSTALGLAWKSGIAAEVIGIPSRSIGEMLYSAKVYLNTVDLFTWTVIIVVISVLFEKFFMMLLRLFYRKLETL
ncbi:MAG: ABC transporter permease subunit [Eubacteriales bacterium]|nr:ABC transporter permease subunit [Eubacteriales bacterium]